MRRATSPGDRVNTVFVHGSGRAGADAWPLQAGWDNATFLVRPGFGLSEDPVRTDFDVEAALVNEACGVEGAHVVASSFGALAAWRAASLPDTSVRSLTLLEPAVFALGRGGVAVEAHIRAVDPVMQRAAGMSPGNFIVALYTEFGIPDPQAPTTREGLLSAERMRLQRAPWDAELDDSVPSRIPTLVITGGWNAEYEELAGVVVGLGAQHRQITGFGHGIQDAPQFGEVLAEWLGSVNRP